METRDILDYQGNVIGQLTLDEGVPEQQWTDALAFYALPPKGMPELIFDKLVEYRKVAPTLLTELYRDNRLLGITTAESDAMFDSFTDVMIRLKEGCFPTAIYRLQQKTPSGFATQEMIDTWIRKIQSYL